MARLVFSLAVLVGLAVGGTALYSKFYRSDSGESPFRTEKVTRGDLQINVRATGTVEPEETVDVGAQVVGRIAQLGKDPRGNPDGKAEKTFTAKPVNYETPAKDTKETPQSDAKPVADAKSAPDAKSPARSTPATSDEQAAPNQKPDPVVQYRKKKLGPESIGKSHPAPAEKSNGHVATATATTYDPAFADRTVDYGSPVVKDMILAQIDPAVYKAQFDQATASLAQANAKVLQADALVAQTKAEWDRAQKLQNLKIPSRSPTGDRGGNDTLPIKGISDADYVLAQANAQSAEADLAAAKAAVLQQQAVLELAKTNLNYTTIVSPIDGTIIERRVNIGQTVVSSLNAPSLFLIAGDLRRMQVWASVNEADIAKVTPGTKVHFRVDALPKDTFHGVVVQRRLNAQMTQNVVIYTVVISVDNSELKLLPYLTADVYFEVDNRKDTLLVPNAALRYKPAPELIDSEAVSEEPEAKTGKGGHSGRHEKKEGASSTGRLWVVSSGTDKLRPVEVQTGLSDFTTSVTEITGGDIHEGDEIVTGENRAAPAASGGDVTNPLAPPRFRGGGRGQSKG
jgi:HlyD family secretion protein